MTSKSYLEVMTVEAIKEAIAELPEEERGFLASWIIEQDYDEWDKEIVRDFSRAGRGYHLIDEVKADIGRGNAKR